MPKAPNDNLWLWSQVEETPEKFQDPIEHQSHLTSIRAGYLIKKATEMFGPMSVGWGLKDENEEYAFLSESGLPNKFTLVVYTAKFWWTDNKGEIREFRVKTSAKVVDYKDLSDEDMFKKVRTDAVGKALSDLGFSMDVRLREKGGNRYNSDSGKSSFTAPQKKNQTASSSQKGSGFATEKQTKFLYSLLKKNEVPDEQIKYFIGTLQEPKDVQKDYVSYLIEYLKEDRSNAKDSVSKLIGAESINNVWVNLIEKGTDPELLVEMCQDHFGAEFPVMPTNFDELEPLTTDSIREFYSKIKELKDA